MKKASVILSALLIILFAFMAMGSGEEETTKNQGSETVSAGVNNPDELGDYAVVIDSCRLAKSLSGSKAQ